ncbi:hypothetical protein BRADI_1g44293v3 [Brachypodium distachyon]|uniref:HTH myb-type domain-containing protein n=1 Tax=Brachypodium distachyon TaxID=15368 RepID=A0A0Q3S109_BRADI|nr:hypothetical protein BRADI_1g44293v3 [Brachypodium distachyon]
MAVTTEWTSSEVEEARSVIASLSSKYCRNDGEYHDNIIGELQAKFPWKTMHQVRDLYVDLVVEMETDMTQHVGIVETMKKVPVVKENKVEVLENKVSMHQPVLGIKYSNLYYGKWSALFHFFLIFFKLFLHGLRVYGRGKWRDISKNFVTSRTPLQISSHAQKYFKRLQKGSEKQRYSINDVELDNNDRMNTENNARPSQRAAAIPTSSFLQVSSNPSITMDNIGQFKFPF